MAKYTYDEDDLSGLVYDLLAEGDVIGARTAEGCCDTIVELRAALEYIASGESLDPVMFAKDFLSDRWGDSC